MPHTARVITVSDRSAAGLREDRGGPLAVSLLRDAGFDCGDPVVVPDGADSVEAALRAALATGAGLVVTTGGTGIAPPDRTPEDSATTAASAARNPSTSQSGATCAAQSTTIWPHIHPSPIAMLRKKSANERRTSSGSWMTNPASSITSSVPRSM